MPFAEILIANRGEIALRIIRTARQMGYRTVAVYSEADAAAPHVAFADRAVCIGPAVASASYLNAEAILAAARATGAGAIHPGYGFLAENASFARACADAGLVFIGPPAEAIELMGNKRAAKDAVARAEVPGVPGYQGEDQSEGTLAAEAQRIGYPVMVKAAAGGGGRGMRLVNTADALSEALRSARSEATNAFGSGELILEKALVGPRHVEIQVFADTHGNVIHLGERDCSVQRRHQKVIEESPSPAVDADLRRRMGRAAVDAARACGYVGAGTVELLLDADGSFYFLEMNTRLQVEHPVTELVTGLDLVAWQIRVARGERLPLKQEEVTFVGHAMEARLYAEDPADRFLPQTGQVLRWCEPAGDDVRVDHAVVEGMVVSPHYDPMLAKVVTHADSRDGARRKLLAALADMTLLGVTSNKGFLQGVLAHPVFAAGGATTAFVSEQMDVDHPTRQRPAPTARVWALSALLRYLDSATPVSRDETWIGWRSGATLDALMRLGAGETRARVWVRAVGPGRSGRRYLVRVAVPDSDDSEPRCVELEVISRQAQTLVYAVDGVRASVRWAFDEHRVLLDLDDGNRVVTDLTHVPPQRADGAGSGILKAPLDGAVVALHVAEGARVTRGQLLMVVEAMKMEHPIQADVDGTLRSLPVAQGDQVRTRQVLAEITPDGAEPESGSGAGQGASS